MVYYITGSNVFGQWLDDDDHVVLSGFRKFTANKHDLGIGLRQANLVKINWSYNIFEADRIFYITGAWGGKEQQLVRIPIPEECSDANVELSITGNDYKILLVGKNVNKLWVIDLKSNEVKKLQFYIEEPNVDIIKKLKVDNSITKAEITNESCIFLTSNGDVYCGILPSYVDTRHCRGKVIDARCGYEHFIILTEEGRVYTWGNGRRLQLGHGDISTQELPTEIDALAGINIIKICAGGWHTLALSEFGDVYAWGWNNTGQLGIKNKEGKESYSIPTLLDLYDENETLVEKNVKDIACGSRHSALILEDHTVWTTGCNKYGQLGLSEDKCPTLNHFRKVFNCHKNSSLICGPWSTTIHSN